MYFNNINIDVTIILLRLNVNLFNHTQNTCSVIAL